MNAHDDRPAPFGSFAPRAGYRRLIELAQRSPRNFFGKQLAQAARSLYLMRAKSPVDVTVGKVRLRSYLRENTCERKFVFTPWRFDPAELDSIAKSLPADGVFVDVGANIGLYTLTAALLLGARGRIIALEPHPTAYGRLLFNIDATRVGRADWPRIDVLQLGVSANDEARELRIDGGNLGGGSIAEGPARFSASGSDASMTIRCQPLLRVFDDCGIERPDVMKVDIEGAEDLALLPFLAQAGDERLPGRLIVENSDHLWTGDLRAAIEGRGYAPLLRSRLNTVYAR
ncbi:MAG TPA: FkbM family methyltransferase [Steroidobacteraceae bacterium]|nr:FkbM family methyltransferase [Steroidobacteraceae bacterium]